MIQSIVSVVFFLCIIFFCMIGTKKKTSSDKQLIGFETSGALKGAAIMMVFGHHFWQLTFEEYNKHTFIGYLGVTIFFLVAGYVSQKQLNKKGKSYISFRFIIKKIIRLYIPYTIIGIIFSLVKKRSFQSMVAGLIHIEDDWFLCAITIMYIGFFVVSKIFGNKMKLNIPMLVYVLIYMITAKMIGLGAVWYNTVPAFYIGMVAANYEEKIKNSNKLIMIISGLLSVILCAATSARIWIPEIISVSFSIVFSIFVLVFLARYKICNRILIWLGSISWEFYLFQSKVLSFFYPVFSESYYIVYFLCALVLSLLLGFLFCKLDSVISRSLNKLMNRKRGS